MRQSIIHVEQDDIDFDEEEIEGDRRDQSTRQATDTTDVDMAQAETEMDGSYNEAVGQSSPTRMGGVGAQLATSSQGGTSPAMQQALPQPRQRFKITHDRYIQLQNLVVLHLREYERQTENGVDREELIDWYLESREGELESIEEVNHERDLFIKVLKKLVKVSDLNVLASRIIIVDELLLQDNFILEVKGDPQESLPTSTDESGNIQEDPNARIYYLVHPSLDPDTSSSYQ